MHQRLRPFPSRPKKSIDFKLMAQPLMTVNKVPEKVAEMLEARSNQS